MSESPQLGARRAQFHRAFPHAANAESALRSRTANPDPFFYFAQCRDQDLRGCWWVLGRLGGDLEKQFAIAGEVLFLFTPYEDLQRRTFNVLTERLRREVRDQQVSVFGGERFTPDPTVAMLWAPDPERATKLEAWNLEANGSIVAAMPDLRVSPERQKQEIARSLHEVLAARDLYRGRNPVTGNDFFGRQDTLLSLRAELSAGRSIGLFGLRRSGKTSVVREFQRRARASGTAVVLSDLEAIGDIAQMPPQLAADLTNTLRDLKQQDSTVWVGSEVEQRVESAADLGTRIVRVAEKNRHIKFVIALDEIESLVPLVDADPQQVRLFLGSLRRAAQATSNVAILLTGVTTRFFDESMLAQGVENPLFGFVEEFFLRPFALEETTNLVRKLGRGMVLCWTDDALATLQRAAGGFPFLVRDLASAVRRTAMAENSLELGTERLLITGELVDQTIPLWAEAASSLWAEILRTLETHHAVMAELARCRTDGEIAEWLAVGPEAQAAAKGLESLGLLDRTGETWIRSQGLQSLQNLGSVKQAEAAALREQRQRRAAEADRLRGLSGSPEGQQLEFKSTLKFNTVTKQPDKRLEEAVVRTVAGFANAGGGTLLAGVDDAGAVIGIGADLKLFRNSIDKLELYLRDCLVSALGAAFVAKLVRINFVSVDDQTVCEVVVEGAAEPVWVTVDDGDVFYVRSGNQTRTMPNREVMPYCVTHFGPISLSSA